MANIESVLNEKRSFPPPEAFAKQANISSAAFHAMNAEMGSLIEVLPKASITEPGLSLYFPKRAALAPKLRAFIETIREFSET